MEYKGISKHKEPWQPGRRGTLCHGALRDSDDPHQMLAESEPHGNQRYATNGVRAFVAQSDSEKLVWHGYPIGWRHVPPAIRERWVTDGKVRRSDFKRNWD